MHEILDKVRDMKMLVIGDVMLDKYVEGHVKRISPEAPVPVVNVKNEKYIPGGAANVANNTAALGATTYLLGIAGEDQEKNILMRELELRKIQHHLVHGNRHTTMKLRVIGQSQQLLRVDYEDSNYIDKDCSERLKQKIEELLPICDAVIISDYAKGIITMEIMDFIIAKTKEANKLLVIDPKPKHKAYFRGCGLITPNLKEAAEMAGMEEESNIVEIGRKLVDDLNCNVLVTRGEQGMSLFELDGKVTHIPTKAKNVYDVTGAGDTVVGTITATKAAGAELTDAAVLANHAAGIVVGEIGCATVTIDQIKRSLTK